MMGACSRSGGGWLARTAALLGLLLAGAPPALFWLRGCAAQQNIEDLQDLLTYYCEMNDAGEDSCGYSQKGVPPAINSHGGQGSGAALTPANAVPDQDSDLWMDFAERVFEFVVRANRGVAHSLYAPYNTPAVDTVTAWRPGQIVTVVGRKSEHLEDNNVRWISSSRATRAFVVSAGASITLTSITIMSWNSTYGPALYVNGGSARVTDCVFSGNHAAESHGGAVWVWAGGTLRAENTLFLQNSASNGGAVHVSNFSQFIASKTRFVSNSATGTGGAVSVYSMSNFTATDCTFAHNTAQGSGGAISVMQNSAFSATNAEFHGNKAKSLGGSVFSYTTGVLQIKSSTFIGNEGGATPPDNDGVHWYSVGSWGNAPAPECSRSLRMCGTQAVRAAVHGMGGDGDEGMHEGEEGMHHDPSRLTSALPASQAAGHMSELSREEHTIEGYDEGYEYDYAEYNDYTTASRP